MWLYRYLKLNTYKESDGGDVIGIFLLSLHICLCNKLIFSMIDTDDVGNTTCRMSLAPFAFLAFRAVTYMCILSSGGLRW